MAMQMKDSGIEWIGEIPEEWEVRRIKHLIAFPLQYGANETGEDFDEMLPRYIRITDISANNELKNDGKLSLSNDKAKGYILQDGDVLFARSGATVGKTFYYKGEYGLACFAGYMIRLSADSSKISGRFIYYYTLSKAYAEWTNMIFIQATIQNISAEKYSELHMPVPPLLQQEKIIRYLDSRCAEIDAVIAAKQHQNELLQEQRQSIIFEAVTKGLDPTVTYKDSGVEWIGEIPAGWEVRKLKAVAWVQTGIAKGKDLSGEEDTVLVPYLRVANVQDGFLNLDEIATIEVRPTDVERYRLKNGDVLMNEGGDYDKLGRGHIWREEVPGCIHQNHVFAVRPFAIRSEWLNWYTGASPAQFYFMTRANQSTNLASISANNLKDLLVLCPSDTEQQQIADYLGARCAELDRVVAANNAVIDKLKEYRQSLIYEAVTGKIAV